MEALIEMFWEAVLAGDEETANELAEMMDEVIDLKWFIGEN